MRRGDRHIWRWVGAAAFGVILLVGALAAHAVASRREARMQLAADAAGAAIRAARDANAMRWAPDELAAAERASRDALTRQRVEQVRTWPIPDADPVVDAWAAAARAARSATELARRRHAAGANSATEQIDGARQALSDSEAAAAMIYLGSERRLLAAARTVLDEARAYQRAGDLETAAARARAGASLAAPATDRAVALAERLADADTIARWQRWKSETIAASRREGRAAIVVVKDAHQMTLFVRGEPVKTYAVELGFNWIADKLQEGDGSTPEGRYRVTARMDHLASNFYKALLIDYPNAEDRAEFSRARRQGDVAPSARIGGLIEIHGGGGRQRDWTDGCVAVINSDMDDLFRRVTVGTPVTIVGSDSYGPIAEFADRHKRDASPRRP
jgi:murein L,D-transpeptidase YafK